jgi:hypothetical protein
MVDIEALMEERRAELHLLLRRHSPRYRLCRFKTRYIDTYNVLVIYPPNKENNWLSFDIIEPLQMFCHMYSLLWYVHTDEETGMLEAVIEPDTNVIH